MLLLSAMYDSSRQIQEQRAAAACQRLAAVFAAGFLPRSLNGVPQLPKLLTGFRRTGGKPPSDRKRLIKPWGKVGL